MYTPPTPLETIVVRPPGSLNPIGYSYLGWSDNTFGYLHEHAQKFHKSYDVVLQEFLEYSDSTDYILDLMKGLLSKSDALIKSTIKAYANLDFKTSYRDSIPTQLITQKENLSPYYNPGDLALVGSAATPIALLAHYLWGKGKDVTLPIQGIALDIETKEVPVLNKLIVDKKNVGKTAVDTKFAYKTYDDSPTVGATLGSITLKLEGVFNRTGPNDWSFDGKLRAFNDVYDANPKADRDAFADLSTKILEKIGLVGGGTPFDVIINGEIDVHFDKNDKVLDPRDYVMPSAPHKGQRFNDVEFVNTEDSNQGSTSGWELM